MDTEEFLSHYGVKGQKWGVRRRNMAIAKANERAKNPNRFGNRNVASAQRNVDRHKRVAAGTASLSDQARIALVTSGTDFVANNFSLREVAASRLDRAERHQVRVNEGRRRISDTLNRLGGVDYRELNLSHSI